MDYRKEQNVFYIRIDKGENVLDTIRAVCRKEQIGGGFFTGIGACDSAVLSTYLPEKADFIDHRIAGMIEMVSLTGNISCDKNGQPFLHSHAVFSQRRESGEIAVTAGHLTEARIGYTGEIVLTAAEKAIARKFDDVYGIEVWDLS